MAGFQVASPGCMGAQGMMFTRTGIVKRDMYKVTKRRLENVSALNWHFHFLFKTRVFSSAGPVSGAKSPAPINLSEKIFQVTGRCPYTQIPIDLNQSC
jgi:hypothetical protein